MGSGSESGGSSFRILSVTFRIDGTTLCTNKVPTYLNQTIGRLIYIITIIPLDKLNGPSLLTVEEKLDAIADEERRQILLALHLRDPDIDLPIDLREFVSEHRLDLVKIFHSSLPKLSKYGLIEWDEWDGEISKGPDFERIVPLLTLLYEHQDDLSADWFDSE